jgi:lyso-ornithine lipid O-acyltransferase
VNVGIAIKVFRVLVRLLLFFSFVLSHIIRGFFIHSFIKDPIERKRQFAKLSNWVNGVCSRAFNIRIKVINPPPPNSPGLIVGNHLGFIDIIASGAVRPMLYVTSNEMRQTPFLGLITEMVGCIYVERRSRMGIQRELEQIITTLREGFNVCLYPESTSHNGEHVLPFKRTLLTSAAYAGVPIFPYVFNFKSIEGESFNLSNRDHVCWYGHNSFIACLIKALSLKYVEVEIKFLEPLITTVDMKRSFIAETLHDRISKEFIPVQLASRHSLNPQIEGI